MKNKVGTDIVYIPKLEKLMKNEGFIKKVFHETECKEYNPEHMAGIFAAKEAFFKALDREIEWLKIEVKKKSTGKPELILSSELKEVVEEIDLSISHDKDYAIAAVSLLLK